MHLPARRRNSGRSKESRWSGSLEPCSKRSCSPPLSRQAISLPFFLCGLFPEREQEVWRGSHMPHREKGIIGAIRERVRHGCFQKRSAAGNRRDPDQTASKAADRRIVVKNDLESEQTKKSTDTH